MAFETNLQATSSDISGESPSMVRNRLIDIARGIAIILVVFGHSLEIAFSQRLLFSSGFELGAFEIWRTIYSFHMPLFYFVSGMAALSIGRKSFQSVLANSLALILLAYAANIMTALILGSISGASLKGLVMSTLKPLIVGYQMPMVVTWFLISLAFVQIFAWCFYNSNYAGRVAVIAFVAGVFSILYYIDKNYYYGRTWIIGLIFFILGKEFVTRTAGWRSDVSKTAIAAVILVVALLFLYPLNSGCLMQFQNRCDIKWGPEFVVVLAAGETGFLPLFFLTAAIGIALILSIAQLVKLAAVSGAIAQVGMNTLAIFFVNGIFLAFIRESLMASLYDRHWLIFVVIVVSVPLQIALAMLAQNPVAHARKVIANMCVILLSNLTRAQRRN